MLLESANPWKSQQAEAAKTANKWSKSGLLEGIGSEIEKNNMAVILDNLGLAETIKDTVNTWQKQYEHLKIHLLIKGDLNHLNETLNINIYRIIQEAMNNALKHSKAKAININLVLNKKGFLELNFSDDGQGMDLKKVDQTKNFGILGMQERIQSLNGSFELISKKNQGTQILISVPT